MLLVPPTVMAAAQTLERDLWNEYCDTCDLTDSTVFCCGWNISMYTFGPNIQLSKPNEVTNVVEQATKVTYQLSKLNTTG